MARDAADAAWWNGAVAEAFRAANGDQSRPVRSIRPDGTVVWIRACRCSGACRCGISTEAAVLSHGQGCYFMPRLERAEAVVLPSGSVFATSTYEHGGQLLPRLHAEDAAQVADALSWLHSLSPTSIFPLASDARHVVIHADVFAENVVKANDRVILTDFADCSLGVRSEDLLAALKLPFADLIAVEAFLSRYRDAAQVDFGALHVDVGVDREFARRRERRRRRGQLPPDYEHTVRDELRRAAITLERAYGCDVC